MTNDTNDWRDLREFAGVDLAQSFVLSWDLTAGTLLLDVDLCLQPEHAFYEKPRPAERICIRPATLEFPFCTSMSRDGVRGDPDDLPTFAESLGHSRIEDFRRVGDGRYELYGVFGKVAITSERPLLRLKEAAS